MPTRKKVEAIIVQQPAPEIPDLPGVPVLGDEIVVFIAGKVDGVQTRGTYIGIRNGLFWFQEDDGATVVGIPLSKIDSVIKVE